jgi:anthranilate synthase/phosphoribosyltransferase
VIKITEVLIIDNFDSFVYNLYQYVGELGVDVTVKRNTVSIKEIENVNPKKIIISPGPGRPEDAGISIDVIRRFSGEMPILGVCLGHQAIAAAFGGDIVRAQTLLHGKTSMIVHNEKGIFEGVKNPFIATRYHSLVIDKGTLPSEIKVTAKTKENNTIMGVKHKNHDVYGVQFHPESILTAEGKKIMENFLKL